MVNQLGGLKTDGVALSDENRQSRVARICRLSDFRRKAARNTKDSRRRNRPVWLASLALEVALTDEGTQQQVFRMLTEIGVRAVGPVDFRSGHLQVRMSQCGGKMRFDILAGSSKRYRRIGGVGGDFTEMEIRVGQHNEAWILKNEGEKSWFALLNRQQSLLL